jgi:hypothetical protein
MKLPDKFDGLFDDLDRMHAHCRDASKDLPPVPASEIITTLLQAIEPLLGDLRKHVPVFLEAVESQHAKMQSTIDTAKQQIAQAEQIMSQLPPIEEARKNLVPMVDPMAVGVAATYEAEMRRRYAPAIVDENESSTAGAAWQDWTLGS